VQISVGPLRSANVTSRSAERGAALRSALRSARRSADEFSGGTAAAREGLFWVANISNITALIRKDLLITVGIVP
jgi:hypothetical protein